jgi:hypothetical protein
MGRFRLLLGARWKRNNPICPTCEKPFRYDRCCDLSVSDKMRFHLNKSQHIIYEGCFFEDELNDSVGDMYLVTAGIIGVQRLLSVEEKSYSVEQFIEFCQNFEANKLFI